MVFLETKEDSMSTSTTIPVTVEPEAATLIDALGLEQPLREMIEHSKQAIPSLRRIEVEYGYKVDDPENPTIVIYLMVDPPGHPVDLDRPIRNDLVRWFLRSYPGEVARYFVLEVLGDRS
jgi:hypothetical protein